MLTLTDNDLTEIRTTVDRAQMLHGSHATCALPAAWVRALINCYIDPEELDDLYSFKRSAGVLEAEVDELRDENQRLLDDSEVTYVRAAGGIP